MKLYRIAHSALRPNLGFIQAVDGDDGGHSGKLSIVKMLTFLAHSGPRTAVQL